MKDLFTKVLKVLNGDKPVFEDALSAKMAVDRPDSDLPPKDRRDRSAPLIDRAGSPLVLGNEVEFIGDPSKYVVVGHDRGEGRILLLTKDPDTGERVFMSVPVNGVRKVVAL